MAFYPHRSLNRSVSPSVTSAALKVDINNKAVRFANAGRNICYVRIGTPDSGTPATTNDTPVLPGESIVLRKGIGEDTVSFISASGTTLHIQPGEEY